MNHKTGRVRTRIAAIAAAIAIVGGGLIAASPAYAQGSFSQDYTNWGCTPARFTGASDRPAANQVRAWTNISNAICAGGYWSTSRVNVNGVYSNTVGGLTAYSEVRLTAASGTPGGRHCFYSDGYCRST